MPPRVVLGALLALLVASGCLSAMPGLELPITDPEEIQSVTETRILVEPAVLRDQVNVTVQLHVDEPVAFQNNGGGGEWSVWIEHEANDTRVTELVRPDARLGADVVHETTLEAGVHEWTFPWNGRTERPSDDGPHEGPRVEPGAYEVHAVRDEIDVRFAGTGTLEVGQPPQE